MMHRPTRFVFLITVLTIFVLACNFSTPAPNPAEEAPAATVEPAPTDKPVESAPATDTPAPTETAKPTDEPLPTPIVHIVSPVVTVLNEKPQVIYDQESIRKAEQKEAYSGDEFLKGRYERPFNQAMDYLPFIDITQVDLVRSQDTEFLYYYIHLQDDPTLSPDEEYGFGIELDEDLDGRGDYLVWTGLPASKEWSTEGVSVWKDANNSVGGPQPIFSDADSAADGYELNIFDSGVGDDPDLAWSRISPEKAGVIEISFKESILGPTPKFLWGAWSMLGPGQFGRFDHNDYFTFEAAGSPMKGDTQFYPVKDMYALDNTCRAASGFTPQGYEPGLCPKEPPRKCHQVCTFWVNVGAGRICAAYVKVCD